jgi:chromosome segregation ATPase
MDIEVDEASGKIETDMETLQEQIRVQKNISDAHYENYCEMLKRVETVTRELDKARAEVERLQNRPAWPSAPIPIFGELVGPAVNPIRPEPSRLEIAAMIFAGGTEQTITDAFLAAEELIEHARKTK